MNWEPGGSGIKITLSSTNHRLIRSVGLGQTQLQRGRSVRISEREDGSWKAEEESDEDGVIIYLAIKYHQHDNSLVKYGLGLLTTEGYGGRGFITLGEVDFGATFNINFSCKKQLTYIVN